MSQLTTSIPPLLGSDDIERVKSYGEKIQQFASKLEQLMSQPGGFTLADAGEIIRKMPPDVVSEHRLEQRYADYLRTLDALAADLGNLRLLGTDMSMLADKLSQVTGCERTRAIEIGLRQMTANVDQYVHLMDSSMAVSLEG